MNRASHHVGAGVFGFDYPVVSIVDHVGIVAEAAVHGVAPSAAVEHVGAIFAHDLVIARATGNSIGTVEAGNHVI